MKWPLPNDKVAEKDVNKNKEMHGDSVWVTENELDTVCQAIKHI